MRDETIIKSIKFIKSVKSVKSIHLIRAVLNREIRKFEDFEFSRHWTNFSV